MLRTARKPRVSYAEVDSDADGLSSADEGGAVGARAGGSKGRGGKDRAGGDAYGTTKPARKKARRSSITSSKNKGKAKKASEPVKSPYSAGLVLDLPFDLLSEVCSYLDSADLISLAKVDKSFRTLFLSPETRSFWAKVRRRDGYELPKAMDELEFALLVHGKACQACGGGFAPTYLKLRHRLCQSCENDRQAATLQLLEMLNADIVCKYLISDLEDVNVALQELEDEDEQAREANERVRQAAVWTTKSRRKSGPAADPQDEGRAQRYVEECEKKREAANEEIERVEKQHRKLLQLKAEEARKKRIQATEEAAAKEKRTAEELKEDHEWTDEQADFYLSYRRHQVRQTPPQSAPSDDSKGWLKYRNAIQAFLDEAEAERQAEPGRRARRAFLEDSYTELKKEMDDELDGVFPGKNEFESLPAVKALWHPRDAELDEEIWAEELPSVRDVLRRFAEDTRVHAIRYILAAQTNRSVKSLSSRAADYPKDKYGDAFFRRATSSFFDHTLLGRRPVQYPAFVAGASNWGTLEHRLKRGISFKLISAVRGVIDAADLEVDTATPQDLDALGAAFRWPECPRKSSRSSRLSWMTMVSLIHRKGPGVRRLEAGEIVKLEFDPPSKKDLKGKGKAVETADDDADISEREAGSVSELSRSDDSGSEASEDEDDDA
ncbi:hypothetical protein JCM10213_001377 [Rhodosporidiobolus nylandii]